MKKYFFIFLTLLTCIYSCTKEISAEDIKFVTDVKEDTTIIIQADSTYQVNITPADAKVSAVVTVGQSYKSPKNGVISITDKGKVKAIEAGKATVTLKNNSGQFSFNIVVVEIPSKIELKDTAVLIKTGKTFQLTSQSFDQYELKYFGGVTWETVDNSVASVSQEGNLTALKEGNTKVRVSLKNFPTVYSEYPVQTLDHIVYLAGECKNANGLLHPYYWKNNVAVGGLADFVFTLFGMEYSNDNLYFVGRTGDTNKAFLLKNSTTVIFPENAAGATALSLMGNDIYTCGYYTYNGIQTVALWKNSELFPILSNSEITTESVGKTIAISNGDIYVGGCIKNNQSKQVACYWKNHQRIDLSDGTTEAIVNSIFVDGSDVYAAGYYVGVANNYVVGIACYWKNGVKHDLVAVGSNANSIVVSNGDIYVAGFYYNDTMGGVACYWKNGIKYDLALGNGATASNAFSIKVVESNVFISGFYYNTNSIYSIGCYWKNGIRYDIPSTKYSDGSIFPYSNVNCMTID